ncbi:hypothetical protein V5O48_006238 [Marasmius crinis-equi]|uniref:Uncharacterized protein n=1 Tax=Marasmius crinis-equi TaxID=585013 RepID=A0ABR3FK01_9AGAR
MSSGLPSNYSIRNQDHETETFTKSSYVIRSPASTKSPPPMPMVPKRETTNEAPPQRRTHRPSSFYPKIKKDNPVASLYLSLSGMLGFREKVSLVLMVIFGGALVGYCIARGLLMDAKKRMELTIAGELFWFNQEPYKATYIIHIFFSCIGGILVGAQFVPVLRRKFVLVHRINGGVVYFAIVITGRVIMLAASAIITIIGTYYSLWQCDEVLFTMHDQVNSFTQNFPTCSLSGSTLTNPATTVAVHCSVHDGAFGAASCYRATHGMGLWIAAILHILGVEIYLRSTERQNYQKINNTLQPRDSIQSDPHYFFNEDALPEGVH